MSEHVHRFRYPEPCGPSVLVGRCDCGAGKPAKVSSYGAVDIRQLDTARVKATKPAQPGENVRPTFGNSFATVAVTTARPPRVKVSQPRRQRPSRARPPQRSMTEAEEAEWVRQMTGKAP